MACRAIRHSPRHTSINHVNDDREERRGLLADVTADSEIVTSYTEIGEPRSSSSVQIVNTNKATTGTSWYATVFLVVNAALGAGLLNFPKAYDQSGGIVVAVIVQAVLMVFIVGALVILAYCSDVNQSCTYQDVLHSICGKLSKHACSLSVALYCFGTCVTFFIIIADQWDRFLSNVVGNEFCLKWYMNRKFTMSTTVVLFVLPMCFPKRIDFLKYASVLGVFAVIYCVFLVSYKYFLGEFSSERGEIKTSPSSWTDVFIVVPVICFGYQCHVSVVPIYSCMAKRTLPEFIKTILTAILLCVLTYTFTAIFGYLTFGSHVQSDILVSYHSKHLDGTVVAAVILIGIKMYTTYPILLFCGRAAFDSVWVDAWRLTPDEIEAGERRRRVITVVIWFIASLALAVFVADIGVVISVLGSLAAVFIFTFPGMLLLQVLLQGHIDKYDHPVQYRILFIMAVMYLVIGGFIFGVVLTQAIWNDVTYHALRPQTNTSCIPS